MGRVLTAVTVENLEDTYRAKTGLVRGSAVRTLRIAQALVDTGATFLSLPRRMIRELGLEFRCTRKGITPVGSRPVRLYSSVRLSMQGRDCIVDVAEVSDKSPPLVGQVPLEIMDFVVDPRHRRVIPNPEHGGEWTIELL